MSEALILKLISFLNDGGVKGRYVVGGSWAVHFYKYVYPKFQYNLRTRDVDFVLSISIKKQPTIGLDVGKILIDKGFDPVFGARPLKRTIQRLLEDPLSEEIIAGRFKGSEKIKVVREKENFVFQ